MMSERLSTTVVLIKPYMCGVCLVTHEIFQLEAPFGDDNTDSVVVHLYVSLGVQQLCGPELSLRTGGPGLQSLA